MTGADLQIITPKDRIEIIPPRHNSVVLSNSPFDARRTFFVVKHGSTILDILHDIGVPHNLVYCTYVHLDGDYILPQYYGLIKPNEGVLINASIMPHGGGGGGGGKSPLRTILTLAVIVATITFAPQLGATLAFNLGVPVTGIAGISSVAIGKAIATVAITTIGNLLTNAIAPPRSPTIARQQLGGVNSTIDSPTLFITGSRNRSNPFGTIPDVLGKSRMVPPLGALPFTEIAGDEQFLRMMVVWGYGPLKITDLKIGETPIAEFDDVQIETVDGQSGFPPNTLFPDDVFEDQFQIVIKEADGFTQRVTKQDVDEFSVDFTFPRGLLKFGAGGSKNTLTVDLEVRFRIFGSNDAFVTRQITVSEKSSSAIRRSERFEVTRGQYEVEVRRTTLDQPPTNSQNFDEFNWTVLRSITNEYPINEPGLATTALRIKATDQLSGVVDQLNAVVSRIAPDWDTGSQVWISRETNNPASLIRYCLESPARAEPSIEAEIDLQSLQDFHDFCVFKGFSFNKILDAQSSLYDIMSDISSAGRGALLYSGSFDTPGVLFDDAQTTPITHITPRNSFGFEAELKFLRAPDAFRVRFINEEQGYRQDERIVFDDGFDATNANVFEGLELPGVTNPQQIFSLARYHLAVGRLRPHSYATNQGYQNFLVKRGDLVRLQHDAIGVGISSGRIKSVTTDGGGNTLTITVDVPFIMEAGKSYGAFITTPSNSDIGGQIVTVVGETSTATFSTPLTPSQAVLDGDLFHFGELGQESNLYLVKGIEPGQDETAKLTLIDYAPSVYNADSGPIPAFSTVLKPAFGTVRPIIDTIISDETVLVRLQDGQLVPRVLVNLLSASQRTSLILGVELQWRIKGNTGFISVTELRNQVNAVTIEGVEAKDVIEIKLRFLTTSQPGEFTPLIEHTVLGLSAPPVDIDSLFIEDLRLRWVYPIPPIDFAGFRVRVLPGTIVNWDLGKDVFSGLVTVTEADVSNVSTSGSTVFMVKAEDATGNQSVNPTFVIIVFPDIVPDNNLFEEDFEAANYPGLLTNGTLSGTDLIADGDGDLFLANDNDLFLFDDNAAFLPGGFKQMEYIATFTLPGTEIADADSVIVEFTQSGSWQLLYRTGTDPLFLDPPGGGFLVPDAGDFLSTDFLNDFAPWPGKLLIPAGVSDIQFKFIFDAGDVQGVLSSFKVIIDARSQVERLNDVSILSGGTNLPIALTWRQIDFIGLTLQDDGGSATTVKFTDRAITGPNILTLNKNGANTTGLVDAELRGF